LTFNYDSATTPLVYLDLSQIASVVNRRFYRQGINWAVAGFKFLTTGTGQIQISKLPSTWVLSNSWEKSFRSWQRMNNEALAEAESARPKFLDFKIYADADHHRLGFANNLMPFSQSFPAPGSQFLPGEWESSKLRIPDAFMNTAERELVAVGSNYPGVSPITGLDAVSLIEGYAASRGLPNIADPNTPSDADDANGVTPENWMSALFNQGTEQTSDVLEDMITENNVSPYPFENGPVVGGGTFTDTMYPNGANQATGLEVHDQDLVTATTIGGTTRMKGGSFPCGLIKIASSINGQISFQVDLVPGTHRGYLCEPMTEM